MAAATALRKAGMKVFLSELQPANSFVREIEELREAGVEWEAGGHTDRVFAQDAIVVCPGIPRQAPVLREAIRRQIPIFSEIEIAYRLTKAPIIAVTGTNGKTTTAALTASILKRGNRDVYLGGNIGVPLVKIALQAPPESLIVAEIGAPQLEHIHSFRPHIAVLLNFSEDHLDRYQDMDEYRKTKSRIVEFQTESNWVVRNADDLWSSTVFSQGHSFFFSVRSILKEGLFLEDRYLTMNFQGERVPILPLEELPLVGLANVENALAAASVALILGMSPAQIASGLKSFSGVEHRLETIGEVEGVLCINDSSATNPLSAIKAMEAMRQPFVLIAGGSDKGMNFLELGLAAKKLAKAAILFGATREKIGQAFKAQGFCKFQEIEGGLEEVVNAALEMAEQGDAILFSPACASFDMFRDYEHRGESFKCIVRERMKSR